MAKPKTTDTTKIFNLDLPITEANCKKITAMIEREDLSEAQKVGGVALQLLNDLAEGGMMLKSDDMEAIRQATGIDVESGADLIAPLSEATSRKSGMLMIPYYVDPSVEAAYQNIADMQSRTVQELFQEVTDFVIENEMVYNLLPQQRPDAVYMTPAARAELVGVLEGEFSNGTELAKLVKKFIGADGLFEGVFADAAEKV